VPIVLIFATWYDRLLPIDSGAIESGSVPAGLGENLLWPPGKLLEERSVEPLEKGRHHEKDHVTSNDGCFVLFHFICCFFSTNNSET
jgi:hypothetical protein